MKMPPLTRIIGGVGCVLGAIASLMAASPPWNDATITKGSDSMLVYAMVTRADGTPVAGSASKLAAFSGGGLSGSVNATKGPGGSTLYALQVFGGGGNASVGYQFYDADSGNYYKVASTSIYTPGGAVGSIAQPITLTLADPAPSQQVTAIPGIATMDFNPSAPVSIPLPSVSSTAQLPVSMTVVSGPAVISGDHLQVTGAGTVVLEANQVGSADYAPAQPVNTSFVVNKAEQTISSFSPLSDANAHAESIAIPIPAASSGLPVTLSLLSGPATLSGNSVIPEGSGTVVLAADQPGDANFNPAPRVTTSFAMTKGPGSEKTIRPLSLTTKGAVGSSHSPDPRKPQFISFPQLADCAYGTNSFDIRLPTSSSGLPVSIALEGPAKLHGSTMTLTGTGTISLVATQAGDSNFLAAPTIINSFVVKKAQKISGFEKIKNKTFGDPPFRIGTPFASSGLPVIVAVTAGSASFCSNTVSLGGVGTVTLEAIQPGNGSYAEAPHVRVSFAVKKGVQKIAAFESIPDVDFDKTRSITITIPKSNSEIPVNLTVKSGPASLQGNELLLKGRGAVVLAANQPETGDFFAAKEVTVKLRVK